MLTDHSSSYFSRQRGRRIWPVLVLTALLTLGGGAFVWLRGDGSVTTQLADKLTETFGPEDAKLLMPERVDIAAAPARPAQASPRPSPMATEAMPEPEPRIVAPPLDLPPLARSDGRVRELATERSLAEAAVVRRGLATGGLVREMAGAMLEISEGRTPRKRLLFLAPARPFTTESARPDSSGDAPRISAQSYRRYDGLVDAFVALDARTVVTLYRQLEPLFDQAYADLGVPDGDFDEVVGAALSVVQSTPVAPPGQELTRRTVGYSFADPRLEALPAVQRQILRMGPRNTERVLAKLRELEDLWRTPVIREPVADR